jgi:hypothetical protein
MTKTAAGTGIMAVMWVLLCAGTRLGAEPGIMRLPDPVQVPIAGARQITSLEPVLSGSGIQAEPYFRYATDDLWLYLRKGLNYLESPRPLAEPEAVPPSYVHPDGRGFGCYGFSPEAYQDVQRLYPYFREFSWDQVLGSSRLYDLANRAFCDWLLMNLRDRISLNGDRASIYDAVQQAWNLGLSGFKKGRAVVSSRTRRAEEFKSGRML